jgi:hypothetical protein
VAETEQGTALTETYRADQLRIRAGALRRLAGLWSLVDPASLASTVGTFANTAAAMLLGFSRESALETVDYLGEFRAAEGVAGPPVRFRPAPLMDADVAAGMIRGATITGIVNKRRAGGNLAAALDNALVKVLGEAGKIVLGGGRNTMLRGREDDQKALGYERVGTGSACSFCLMLISRGPVYSSARSSQFESHGHCACTGELVYERGLSPSAELAEEWSEVTAGLSGKDARNAWRRHIEVVGRGVV